MRRLPIRTLRTTRIPPGPRKSPIVRRCVAKTTELEALAAGSMKAKEQATVAGSSSSSGCVSRACEDATANRI